MTKVKRLTILNFLGFVIMSILVMCNYTKKFDNSSASFMKIYKNHVLKKLANILAVIASPKRILIISLILISFIAIILVLFDKWNKINNILGNLKVMLFTILIAYFSNDVLKNLFKRARPSAKVISKMDKYSFPSDHSMMAFAFFITIAYILCQYIQSKSIKFIICFLSIFITILIGLSRVYLGKHFMTDIIGGYFLSGFILCSLIWINSRISKYPVNEQKI